MTEAEIAAILQMVVNRCERADCRLSDRQQEILAEVLQSLLTDLSGTAHLDLGEIGNPLDELTEEQRYALLQFIKEEDQPDRSWKVKLLNDWLQNRDSGQVQFVRELYGPQWLNRVKPHHIAHYAEANHAALQLKVGDRIEVCNGLWEWVQENSPCPPQWFPCTVIGVRETASANPQKATCVVRFDDGREYEIQGVYEWNRYNWRWPQD